MSTFSVGSRTPSCASNLGSIPKCLGRVLINAQIGLLSLPVLTQGTTLGGIPLPQFSALQVRCYQHLRKPCRMLFPPEARGPAGPRHRDKRERNNAQVDCRRLCSDLGVISTGFATRIIPSARPTGRFSPRSMRRRYAHGEWCLRENSRPPCRQQVRPRAHLLKPRTRLDAGIDIQPWTTSGPASKTLARCRVLAPFGSRERCPT